MIRAGIALAVALLLAACGGTRPGPRVEPAKPTAMPSTTSTTSTPTAPKPAASSARRGGGYYLDDGPAANIPENLDEIPDAEPKWEPLNRGTARPYVVFGKAYRPYTAIKPHRQKGIASWYGKKFHGQKTSSGEIYDMFAMTAAHTVLPIPSYVRVTNPANGRSVVVRINDRGPFHADRIIDLSYTAAQKLGYIGKGSTEVEIEQIIPGEAGSATYAQVMPPRKPEAKPAASLPAPPAPLVPAGEDDLAALIDRLDTPAGTEKPAAQPSAASPAPRSAEAPAGVYLQLGAFGNPDNAENLKVHLARELDWLDEDIQVNPSALANGNSIHRVQAGPFASRAAAEKAAERIRESMGSRPALVTR